MGKGGKGKPSKSSVPAADDEDALLEAAIAQATAEREAVGTNQVKAKESGAATPRGSKAKGAKSATEGRVFTMAETLAKLDQVMTFTISRLLPDGSKDACPSKNGAVTFYTDAEDAKADLEELKAADPQAKVMLDFTALGRAFALTQGVGGLRAPGPTRLQFSRKIVAEVGESGVPTELRERMRAAGPFPLFYSDKLGSEQFTPVFFTVADLHELFLTCGGDPSALPEPTVTDLRMVVARTLQEKGSWEPLHFVPAKACEALTKELMARNEREQSHRKGFARGAAILHHLNHQEAVKSGDEPPPLS